MLDPIPKRIFRAEVSRRILVVDGSHPKVNL